MNDECIIPDPGQGERTLFPAGLWLAERFRVPYAIVLTGCGLVYAGVAVQVAFEASAPELLADLAAHGLGVAFLPSLFAQYRSDRLAVLQVSPPPLPGRLVLAWRASGPPSPAGRALVSHLLEALASR